ncbi:DUF298-domain-containing protein [Coprinopsis marcescibilis]|uniref:Defective in cullin neddylation protein n=1 Tax=Coprinopsis marcescibilis TaxID=230819 RepID=A0A5C3L3U4_COPMA|nr:DUF298-domain-containing protein [Coprinopsis marcescibilis]
MVVLSQGEWGLDGPAGETPSAPSRIFPRARLALGHLFEPCLYHALTPPGTRFISGPIFFVYNCRTRVTLRSIFSIMPPKRKRAEDGETSAATTSTRSTRNSTRTKTTAPEPAKPAVNTTKAATLKQSSSEDADALEPAQKRKRTTTVAATTAKPPAKRGRKKAETAEDVHTPVAALKQAPQKQQSLASHPSQQSTSTTQSHGASFQPQPLAVAPAPAPAPAPTSQPGAGQTVNLAPAPSPPQLQPKKPKTLKVEPYTPGRALELFKSYADKDDPNTIGPEGFERLCGDAEIPLDGAIPLILAWQMNAADMAKISVDEWTKGTGILKASSLSALSTAMNDLNDLVVLKKPLLKRVAKKEHEPYDRTAYYSYADNPKSAFQKLYSYCFSLAKPEGSRNIDMETSCALWSVLLTPQYPFAADILEFINDKKDTYRATNKDLWSMMLEFCQTVNPTLQDYESDGAWPTLLDDFVLWKKTNGGTNPNGVEH